MKERYPTVSGPIPVPLTVSYTYGDSYIQVSSLNYIPAAPNVVTICDNEGFFLTVKYTEITGTSLTGLSYIEGDINHTFIANIATVCRAITSYDFEAINEAIDSKVDKVDGKQLSSAEYTEEEKAKLAGIEVGAQVNKIEDIRINDEPLPILLNTVNIPVASREHLGTVKVGNGLSLASDGTISADPITGTGISVIEIDGVAVPCLDNVASFPLATTKKDGAMAMGDKYKIDTVEIGAEKNKINSIAVNDTSIAITDKTAQIHLKTVGGCSIVGTGDIPMSSSGDIPTVIGHSVVFSDINNPIIVEHELVFR